MYTPLAKHAFFTIEMYIPDSVGRPVPFSSGNVTVFLHFKQSGSGIPVYFGTIMQRGYGVGGLFRRLASGLLSLLPRIRQVLASTALEVVSDKMGDIPSSEALKKRGLEAGKKIVI